MAGLRTNVLVATGTCLFVTIAPLVINRQSPVDTEIVSSYEVRAVCRNQDEERVRAAAIAAIEVNGIVLHALSSKDFEDGERVVQRVGGEHGVSAVSWKLVPADADDKTVLAEA